MHVNRNVPRLVHHASQVELREARTETGHLLVQAEHPHSLCMIYPPFRKVDHSKNNQTCQLPIPDLPLAPLLKVQSLYNLHLGRVQHRVARRPTAQLFRCQTPLGFLVALVPPRPSLIGEKRQNRRLEKSGIPTTPVEGDTTQGEAEGVEDVFQGQTLDCCVEKVGEESENPATRLIDSLHHLNTHSTWTPLEKTHRSLDLDTQLSPSRYLV